MRALFPVCFESAYIVKRGENDLPSFVSLSFLGTGFKRQENIWLRAWPRKDPSFNSFKHSEDVQNMLCL